MRPVTMVLVGAVYRVILNACATLVPTRPESVQIKPQSCRETPVVD